MSKELVTSEYYVVEQVGEALVDGQLQTEFVIRCELWSTFYGDSLVSTEVVCRGNADEVQAYLTENGIKEVITKGL